MTQNFNYLNSISSVGIGLGNETIFFSSPADPNLGLNRLLDGGLINSNSGLGSQLGLISHSVMEVKKTYVSPNMVQLEHSFIGHVPMQNRSDVTVTQFVKTTRLLTPTSTMERLFASSPTLINRGILPTQPNQVINPLLSQNPSMHQAALNILNHETLPSNIIREAVFNINPSSAYPSQHPSYIQSLSFDPTPAIFQNLNTLNPQENQPMIHGSNLEEVAEENNDEYPWGNDGRTHCVRDNPEGEYGCPVCSAAFPTSQTFANHVKTHYREESKEGTRRRMAAKSRQKNLQVVSSSHGLTAMPGTAFKRRARGRKNGPFVMDMA